MNWLAHVALSESSARFRAGNILPDILGARDLAPLGPEFQRGIECHRAIDLFTDQHPVFDRSRRRFFEGYRRCSAILVDVFYDHLLARDWPEYGAVPLTDFVAEFYDHLAAVRPEIPPDCHLLLEHLAREDWLGANATLDGPRGAIRRVERRLRGRMNLGGAIEVFTREESALADDFREFFPELVAHVRGRGFAAPMISGTGAAIPPPAPGWRLPRA